MKLFENYKFITEDYSWGLTNNVKSKIFNEIKMAQLLVCVNFKTKNNIKHLSKQF